MVIESADPTSTINQGQLESWLKGFDPAIKFHVESLKTATEAKDDSRRPIVSPTSWRISLETYPPAMVDKLFHSYSTLSINGKPFFFNCEGPEELALELVWEDETTTKLLFGILTALDMPDAHMEAFLTSQVIGSLDNALLNPETAAARISQHVATVQLQDTRYHAARGLLRLSPRSIGAENHKGLWPTAFVYAMTTEGAQELLTASQQCTLAIPCGIRQGLSIVEIKFTLTRKTKRTFAGTPLQRAIDHLNDGRVQAINVTETFCSNIHTKWTTLSRKEELTKDGVENLLLYTISAQTSVAKLSHKITQETAILLKALSEHLSLALRASEEDISSPRTVEKLLPDNMWQLIEESIARAKSMETSFLWAKGWPELDLQIVAESRKSNGQSWSRDRSERYRKVFMMIGALAVTAAMDRSTVQQIVFECTREIGDDIKSSCSNIREYKQGPSMTTGGSLPMDGLLSPPSPIPSLNISWRTERTNALEQVDETKVREAIRAFLSTAKGIWLHRQDSFDATIQDDDHHSALTNEELEPIPSGAEWRWVGDKAPEGIEIVDDEFSEAVANAVLNKSVISPQVLNNLGATISAASFVQQDGFYYQTAVVTPEKYPHHLDQIAKTLDLGRIPSMAILRTLGSLRKERKVAHVQVTPTYSLYVSQQIVDDIGRNLLSNMILTSPGQPISILPELAKNCTERILQIISSGGLWIKGMLPQLEETSPQVIHSMVTATTGAELGDIIATLQSEHKVTTVKMDSASLLLPGGKLGTTLTEWQCTVAYGTKIKSSMLPPPPIKIAEEVWKELWTAAGATGYVLIPLSDGSIGESKSDKLVRGLTQLASTENEEFSQAGWPTIPSLLDGLNMQTFGGSWLAQHFLPSGDYPMEILPIILRRCGEVLIIFMGKQDGAGRAHPPMNLYGVINKRDWNTVTTPRDMTFRLDALALTVLQDKVARIILENGHLILPGWTVQAESPAGVVFIKEGSRWRSMPTMSALSTLNVSNPHAWDMREGKNHPSELLLKAISALTTESTIKACRIKEGTLLLAPDRDIDELLQRRIPSDNALGILDLREAPIEWATSDEVLISIQRWLDSRQAEISPRTDDMEVTLAGDAANNEGGAAVRLPHLSNEAKALGHG
jgi:hypothetical protein